MNNKENSDIQTEAFIQKLRHVTLSEAETHSMRERLISYINLHSIPEASPTTIPSFQSTRFFLYSMRYSPSLIAGALVIVLLVSGTGISYAAENSLPGQTLYAVKVDVTEPIKTALITEPVAQAKWQNALVQRRIAEASTLASQNKLATSTQEYLAQAAATHIALSEKTADALEATGDVNNALAIRSDLEAQLSGQVDVLSLIAPRIAAAGDATTTTAVIALVSSLNSQREKVTHSRKATEIALVDSVAVTTSVVDATTTATTDSTKTPAQDVAIAYVDTENSARFSKERDLLEQGVVQFGLTLSTASSTSSTASSTDTASSSEMTASSTDAATTEQKRAIWRKKLHLDVPPATISVPVATTAPSL